MSEELKGIKETKEAVDLGLGLAKALKAAKADGKIDVADIAHLIPLLSVASTAVDGADQVVAELKDLSEAEAAELITHIMTGLVVEDAKARAIVEKSLKLVVAAHSLIKEI